MDSSLVANQAGWGEVGSIWHRGKVNKKRFRMKTEEKKNIQPINNMFDATVFERSDFLNLAPQTYRILLLAGGTIWALLVVDDSCHARPSSDRAHSALL